MDIDYDKLPAGPELDALIARNVMGLELNESNLYTRRDEEDGWVALVSFSSWLPSAMRVAMLMHERGYEMEIFVGHVSPGAHCRFQKTFDHIYGHHQEKAPSLEIALSMAICIAALKAMEGSAS